MIPKTARKGLLAGASPFTMLIMLVFTMIVSFLLIMFAGMLLAPVITGIPVREFLNIIGGTETQEQLNLMRYMQMLNTVSLFVVPALFAAYLFSGNAADYLCLSKAQPVKWFTAVLLMMLAAIPAINLLAALNEMVVFPERLAGFEQKMKTLEESARQMTEMFLAVDSAGGLFLNLFMIAVLPAVGEELIFRGIIQKIFTKWTGNTHAAVIIAGFLFSMMHMQFYGFIPRWILGTIFGYLLAWSGTIWLPVFAHFVNNAVAVTVSYMVHRGTVPESVEVIGAEWHEVPVTAITLAVCIALLWIMHRRMKIGQPADIKTDCQAEIL